MTLFTSAPRNILLALALAGSAAFGAGALAHSSGDAHAMQAGADGAQGIIAHVNGMLQYVYTETGASDAQKTRLAAITQQAQADLARIQNQGGDGHARIFGLLTQPSLDRGAVEAEYAAHMKIHEQVSRRTLRFLLDVAEALTPAQRKGLADHAAQHAAHAG